MILGFPIWVLLLVHGLFLLMALWAWYLDWYDRS
jgi:hypothetical protein